MSLFNERIKAAGFETYDEYLQSPHWQHIRRLYAVSGRPRKCFACGEPNYQLHHISYVRLGREELDDVLPLCRNCHYRLHKHSLGNTPYEIYLISKFFFPRRGRGTRKKLIAQFTNRAIPKKKRRHMIIGSVSLLEAKPEKKNEKTWRPPKEPASPKVKRVDPAVTEGGIRIRELIRRMNAGK